MTRRVTEGSDIPRLARRYIDCSATTSVQRRLPKQITGRTNTKDHFGLSILFQCCAGKLSHLTAAELWEVV